LAEFGERGDIRGAWMCGRFRQSDGLSGDGTERGTDARVSAPASVGFSVMNGLVYRGIETGPWTSRTTAYASPIDPNTSATSANARKAPFISHSFNEVRCVREFFDKRAMACVSNAQQADCYAESAMSGVI